MNKELKSRTAKGLIWSTLERFSAQGVQFVLGIILARLLTPQDYGLVGMLAIFLAVSQTFIDSGFSSALIQKKNRDDLDYSTTFYFNILVAISFYAVLFLTAPLIASFYRQPQLIELTRAIGLTIVINAFAVVQRSKFTINLDFKTQTKASLGATIISGMLGIYFAYTGLGVWALVIQSLARRTIEVLILWWISEWYPTAGFSYARFKGLFSFGSKLLLSGLLDTIYNEIYTIVIGKAFSANTLGFFTRAKQFAAFPSSNITGIVGRVTYPVLSEVQDDNNRLATIYRKIIKLSALLIFPLMMGLAALAHPLIIIILTEKWIDTVWMLQILCFSMMWYPIHAINLNIINVKGRSDLFLRLEVIKKILITIVLVVTIPLGIKAMLLGQVFLSYAGLSINLHYTKQVINYGYWKQMRDLMPVLLLSFTMGMLIYILTFFISSLYLQLLIGLLFGCAFFIGIAWKFNVSEIRELKSFLRKV